MSESFHVYRQIRLQPRSQDHRPAIFLSGVDRRASRIGDVAADAVKAGMASEPVAVARNGLPRRLSGRADEAGVLPGDGHDARDDNDLYGLERRAAVGLRQLFSADPTGRARDGLSEAQ